LVAAALCSASTAVLRATSAYRIAIPPPLASSAVRTREERRGEEEKGQVVMDGTGTRAGFAAGWARYLVV
jgi:hypothetical protein